MVMPPSQEDLETKTNIISLTVELPEGIMSCYFVNLSLRGSVLLNILRLDWLILANPCQDWSPNTIATSPLWIKDDQVGKRIEKLKVIMAIKLLQW